MTVKFAVCPAVTTTFAGCVTITGLTVAGVTMRVAALEVTDPTELVTTTSSLPASAVVTLAKVSAEFVFPASAAPDFRHG